MTMTPFFLELHAAYQSELDDLATDSEGRDVLQQRLREKRREIGFLAQMMWCFTAASSSVSRLSWSSC